jgi:hypothetical protein
MKMKVKRNLTEEEYRMVRAGHEDSDGWGSNPKDWHMFGRWDSEDFRPVIRPPKSKDAYEEYDSYEDFVAAYEMKYPSTHK